MFSSVVQTGVMSLEGGNEAPRYHPPGGSVRVRGGLADIERCVLDGHGFLIKLSLSLSLVLSFTCPLALNLALAPLFRSLSLCVASACEQTHMLPTRSLENTSHTLDSLSVGLIGQEHINVVALSGRKSACGRILKD